MEAIYPITALQKNTAEIKSVARKQLVHVTENGAGAFVFASEEVFDALIARAQADAVYEAALCDSIDRGLADIEAGRVHEYESVEEMVVAIFEKSSSDGARLDEIEVA